MAPEADFPAEAVIGRRPELARLRRAVDQAEHAGQALLLRGDPGVGKSALLRAAGAMATARGWRTLFTDGTLAEQRLPLAGLHKLLRPVRQEIGRLEPHRRQMLESSFGAPEDDLDVFGVALACLDLLASLATGGPVAVLVDDAHWLDRSTADVLAFVARRVEADPIVMVIGSRHGEDHPLASAGLTQLDVNPLDEPSSAALLDASAPDLAPSAREAVLAVAAGNPLALLELPLSHSGTEAPVGGGLRLSARLERGFLGRTRELPAATQDLLLVAAVDDSDDIAEIVTAAGLLAGRRRDVDDLVPAERQGLIRVGATTVSFRHPLVRSAVQQGLPAARRRAAHDALAGIIVDEPDRRAWHRASAVAGRDESVAADLDDAAGRAQRRGSVPGALQALERAAELSTTSVARGLRLLRAAELAVDAGQAAAGRQFLSRCTPLLTDPHDRLRLEAVAELSDELLRGGAQRVDALIELAEQARSQHDQDLALRFLLRAAMRCWHQDFGPVVEQRVVAAVDRLAVADSDARRLVIYAYAAPFDRAGDVMRVLTSRHPRPDDAPADLLMYGYAAACIGAYHEAEIYCTAAADRLREQGRLRLLAEALSLLTWSTLRRTRWHVAAPAADECLRICSEIRHPVPEAAALAASAAIAGIQGDDDAAEKWGTLAEELATATGNTIGLAVTHLARGMTAAGRDEPDKAFEHFWHLYASRDSAHQRMQACRTIGHLADAAARTGNRSTARAQLAVFESLAAGSPAPGVTVALRLARAVLSDDAHARAAFDTALDADWSDWTFEHGRLLLAYGRWLRRQQHVTESRVQLRRAVDAFTRTAAHPWAEQARRELRAAGEARPGTTTPTADAWQKLSPQETQIVGLAMEGLSNKEIGQRLFLSPRTVGSHLYRIFPKLGVTSRAQLARALGGPLPATPPVPPAAGSD